MTNVEREEAIYQLNREIHNAKVLGRRFWYYETAIEALKKEPCEDAISRMSALREIALKYPGEPCLNLKGWLHKKWEKKYTQYLECEKIIRELPSVKTIRPKGHWVESENQKGKYFCSCCGGKHTDPENGEWIELFDYRYAYCPLCGEDLR